jgi:hypothetical protein
LDWADAGIDRVPPGGTDPVFTERYDVGPVFIADGIRNVSTTMTSRSMTNNSLATSSWSAEIARLNFEEKFDGYLRTTGNTTTASVTSLTVEVPPEGYPVGTSLMALVGTTHVAATTMTATDPRGNTWTTLQSGFNTSASPGVAGWLIHTKVTTALVGGDLITFTASAAATRWSITISSFSDDITPSHGVVNNYGNGSAPVTYTSGPITTTATNSLIFGGHASGNQLQAISQQTGDDAVISTWWLPAGTSLPIRSVRGQYRYKAPGTYELQLACTVTGPVVSFAQAFTVSGPAPPASGLKVWDGSTWVDGNPKVWDGAAWVLGSAKVWDGSAWI